MASAPELDGFLAPPDPWAEMRAFAPGDALVRVIDARLGLDYFLRFVRSTRNVALGIELYDGATIWLTERNGGRIDARNVTERALQASIDRAERIALEDAANARWGGKEAAA